MSTLTASAGGTKLQPTPEQIEQLQQKGITNEQLQQFGIADNINGLTRSEAREILLLANRRGDSRLARRREEGTGTASGVEGTKEGQAGSLGESITGLNGTNGLNSDDEVFDALLEGNSTKDALGIIIALENIHGVLRSWYGDKPRSLAERLTNLLNTLGYERERETRERTQGQQVQELSGKVQTGSNNRPTHRGGIGNHFVESIGLQR